MHHLYISVGILHNIYYPAGVPLCPTVNVTNTVNCIIAWSSDDHVLLPITYTISVTPMNGTTILLQNTSQTQFELTEKSISAQRITNYTVMVTACTSAGCSQKCDHTWFSVPLKGTVGCSRATCVSIVYVD